MPITLKGKIEYLIRRKAQLKPRDVLSENDLEMIKDVLEDLAKENNKLTNEISNLVSGSVVPVRELKTLREKQAKIRQWMDFVIDLKITKAA